MLIKGIVDCDLINYKEACLTIESPKCNFKCDRDCGFKVCQNSSLAFTKSFEFSNGKIIEYFDSNPITKAICFQGLEPLDTFEDLMSFIRLFREKHNDYIVIYTGYKKEEIKDKIDEIKKFKNIIIKFGRFIPNQKSIYDKVLGVTLSSDNQYAEVIS